MMKCLGLFKIQFLIQVFSTLAKLSQPISLYHWVFTKMSLLLQTFAQRKGVAKLMHLMLVNLQRHKNMITSNISIMTYMEFFKDGAIS